MGLFKKAVEVGGLVFDHGLSQREVDDLDRMTWDEAQKGNLYMRIGEVVGFPAFCDDDQALRVYAVVALLHPESDEAIDYFRDKVFDLARQNSGDGHEGFANTATTSDVVATVAPKLIDWLISRDGIESGSDFRDRAAMLAGTVSIGWSTDPDLLRRLASRFPDQASLWSARINTAGKTLLEPLVE